MFDGDFTLCNILVYVVHIIVTKLARFSPQFYSNLPPSFFLSMKTMAEHLFEESHLISQELPTQ